MPITEKPRAACCSWPAAGAASGRILSGPRLSFKASRYCLSIAQPVSTNRGHLPRPLEVILYLSAYFELTLPA